MDLKWSYGVHTFRIDGGDVWSLLTKYEGRTINLSGLLIPEIVKKQENAVYFPSHHYKGIQIPDQVYL